MLRKVLHVYRTYFPDPPGGLQEAIRQICVTTKRFGVESKIFALSPTPAPSELSAHEGDIIRCRSWAAPASCDLGGVDAFRRFRTLSRWADIVHYHFPWPFADVLRLFSARDKPAVMTYHSDILRQRYVTYLYYPLLRQTIHAMSAVVATSPGYARTSPILTKVVQAERLRVIPLGMEDMNRGVGTLVPSEGSLDRFSLGDTPFFLSLGVLRYYKGLHTLIDAAANVDAKIVIAGSGPEGERLRALAAHRSISNVAFVGQVSNDEKHLLLSRCRALVLPSHLRSEAFGMVLVEAAMFGRPMITREIGTGTSYVNAHGMTGLVVQDASAKGLADAMNMFLADEECANRMGRAARDRYERLFSGAVLGQAYHELYREVLDRR